MKRRWTFFHGILVLLFCIAAEANVNGSLYFPLTPDLNITPSSLCTRDHQDFKEYRYRERIAYCRRNVHRETKDYIYNLYGIPQKCRREFTIDHFIPLSIGGDNSIKNLWPEHMSVKKSRPNLEWDVYLLLKKAEIKQDEAIQIIIREKMNPDIESLAACN